MKHRASLACMEHPATGSSSDPNYYSLQFLNQSLKSQICMYKKMYQYYVKTVFVWCESVPKSQGEEEFKLKKREGEGREGEREGRRRGGGGGEG